MQNITSSTIAAITANFRTLYLASYRKQTPIASRIADVRKSDRLEEVYAVISQAPRMRKWLGERVAHNFAMQEVRLKAEDWEVTMEVEKNHVADDKLGIHKNTIEDMGKHAAFFWDDLAITALNAGTSTLCYDGQYFFDTDHPVDLFDAGSTTQSNLFTSRALTVDNYAYVREQMGSWKLGPGGGRSVKSSGTILLVGPALEVTAKRIVNSEFVTVTGNSVATELNVLKGTAEVVVHPDIPTGVWYLLDTSNSERPIVVVQRQMPEFVAMDEPTNPSVFWRKKLVYGVDARGVAGYGPWFLAARASA